MIFDFTAALGESWERGRHGDFRSAMAEAAKAKRHAFEVGAEEAAAAASGLIGWFCFQAGDVETGIEHAYAAKTFWAGKGDARREAWVGAVYAWLLLEAGLTEEAGDEALKALSLAEGAGDDVVVSWALNVLGVVFWYCKQLERAQAMCERAVAMARACGDRGLLAWWLINEAGVHSEIGYRHRAQDDASASGSLRRAASINREALTLAREVGDDWGLRIALVNAAEYFIALGDLDAAAKALAEWDALAGDPGHRSRMHFLYTKGQLLTKRGDLAEALAVCAEALALAQDTDHVYSETHALRYLSEIYEAMGRFDTALAYFKRFHGAQSRLAAERIQRRARFAEIHYETERFKRMAEAASERADQMAITTMLDPLTGLGNRRRLEKGFDDIRSASERFAVVVLDLDHFKKINDGYSHAVGDEVLKQVAAILQGAVWTGDVVVRLGGEEFVVIMREASLGDVEARCIGVKSDIASAAWDRIASGLKVTASIGFALGEAGADPSRLLDLADRRLYAAKAAGRNRVVGHDEDALWKTVGAHRVDASLTPCSRISGGEVEPVAVPLGGLLSAVRWRSHLPRRAESGFGLAKLC